MVGQGSGLSESEATDISARSSDYTVLMETSLCRKSGIPAKSTKQTSRAESQFAQRGEKDRPPWPRGSVGGYCTEGTSRD